MIVYHETSPDSLQDILKHGLRRDGSGPKTDETVQKADELLDGCIPGELAKYNLSRQHNLYCYVSIDGNILDIKDGARIPVADFAARSTLSVLALEVDPAACFVSELKAYDAVVNAIKAGIPGTEMPRLADAYWGAIAQLDTADMGKFHRPEIMVTYDIPPAKIRVIKQ